MGCTIRSGEYDLTAPAAVDEQMSCEISVPCATIVHGLALFLLLGAVRGAHHALRRYCDKGTVHWCSCELHHEPSIAYKAMCTYSNAPPTRTPARPDCPLCSVPFGGGISDLICSTLCLGAGIA